MYQKLFVLLICLIFVSGGLQAGVALNQNFDGMTPGSLNTAGQGSASDAGGFWRTTSDSACPAIVSLDPNEPDNLALQISGNNVMAFGYSDVAPVAQGSPFMLSFSVQCVDIGDGLQAGSFYLYSDNLNSLSVNTKGIALFSQTLGNLYFYNGLLGTFSYLDQGNLFFLNKDQWVDIKVLVTTWDDGTGYGRYDLWINQQGQETGWYRSEAAVPFSAGALHNGVNSLLLRPRSPTTGAILCNFDNIYISTEPLDCPDVMIWEMGLSCDWDENCVVDEVDMGSLSKQWLVSPSYPSVNWEYRWDCDEFPENASYDGTKLFGYVEWTATVSREVNGGIYTCQTSVSNGSGGARYFSEDSLFNPYMPFMAEFRVKFDDVGSSWERCASIFISSETQDGFTRFDFAPNLYPTDAEGFTTFRVVTYVDDNILIGSDIFYLTSDGVWVKGKYCAFMEDNVGRPDDVSFGDPGSRREGRWHQDYFYWTQQAAEVTAFLDAVNIYAKDVDQDGTVNMKDFSVFFSQWLDSAP